MTNDAVMQVLSTSKLYWKLADHQGLHPSAQVEKETRYIQYG